ncbi:MAG TPA: Ni/Fe hydrogenase, partial [Nitratifractor salsuginis]|nr:Ni/Fe hydrogenase [Nitratifractor salsuginis]
MKAGYERVKRMTLFMRVNHWVVAICMVAAVITGLYIGHPYYQTLIAEPAVDKYVMAWNRWVHLIAAIVFDVSSIIIAYLYFFSRFEKPILKVIPTPKNIKEFFAVF